MGLPRRCAALLPRRRTGRRRPSAGRSLSPDSGQRGAAARLLDGSVLTRWGARTPARGPTTALRPCSLSSSPALRRARAAERAEGRREVGARVSAVAAGAFWSAGMAAQPSDRRGRRGLCGLHRGPGGVRGRGALSAQAHVAAWVAARAREWQVGLRVELGRASFC